MTSTPKKPSVRDIAVVTASGDDDASWLKNSLNEEAKPHIKAILANYKQARSQKSRARVEAVNRNVARKDQLNNAIARFIKPGEHTKRILGSIEKDIAADTGEIEKAKMNGGDWRYLKLRFPRRTKNGAPYSIGELQRKIAAMKKKARIS